MKAILEFNLPEDRIEFDDAVNGADWKLAMWELSNELRRIAKYSDDEAAASCAAKWLQILHNTLEYKGLELE